MTRKSKVPTLIKAGRETTSASRSWRTPLANWSTRIKRATRNTRITLRRPELTRLPSLLSSSMTIPKGGNGKKLNNSPQREFLRANYNPGQKCWDTCTFSLKTFPFRFPPPPSPYQSWISGLKVHVFGATSTRGEGGRHFAQTRPSRASKTERLANTCHIFRLSQGLLSRIADLNFLWTAKYLPTNERIRTTKSNTFQNRLK